MGDVWSFVKSFVGGMFGLSGFESPRKLLFNDIGTTLLAPTVANLWTQQYLDLLSTLVVVILPVVMIEFVVRLVRGLSSNNIGQELLAWGKTMVFILGIVPVLPLLVVSVKALLDGLGYYLMGGLMGTTDLKTLLSTLEVLTGHASLDAILSIVQIVFLFVLFLGNYAMLVMYFAAAFVLVLGVQFRWAGTFGEALFRFAVIFSVFGVAWDFIIMVIFGIDFGLQRIDAQHDSTAKGAYNTVAVLAAALVLPAMWKVLKPAAVAVGSSAATAMGNLRGKKGGGGGPTHAGSLEAESSRQRSKRSTARSQRNTSGKAAKVAATAAGASPQTKAAVMAASKVNARRKARNDKRRAESSSTAQRSAPRTTERGSRSSRRNRDRSQATGQSRNQSSKRQSGTRQARNVGRSGGSGQQGGNQGKSQSPRQTPKPPKPTPPSSGRFTHRKPPPRSPRGGSR